MHSMEAEKHRLSDQVGQLQSKLDRAALHRDLIVGMELQKRVFGFVFSVSTQLWHRGDHGQSRK
jgi:hypothetical protein